MIDVFVVTGVVSVAAQYQSGAQKRKDVIRVECVNNLHLIFIRAESRELHRIKEENYLIVFCVVVIIDSPLQFGSVHLETFYPSFELIKINEGVGGREKKRRGEEMMRRKRLRLNSDGVTSASVQNFSFGRKRGK